MNTLVTGGLGYIGSNTSRVLAERGHRITIVDNLSNSDRSTLEVLSSYGQVKLIEEDVRNTKVMSEIMRTESIDAVIHFAALKSVGESTRMPSEYYSNNISGLSSILDACKQEKVDKFVFSSSATVYGDPDTLPIDETAPLKAPSNPYGATKQIGEQILKDYSTAYGIRYVILRYFNPIGALKNGDLGENPKGIPNNILPYIVQAAAGKIPPLTIFGNDYDTPDGTGIRDYVDVCDLADAHALVLDKLAVDSSYTAATYNVGTGNGMSVLQLVSLFGEVNHLEVPYHFGPRRPGDLASCFASAKKIQDEIGWSAKTDIKDSLRNSWKAYKKLTK